MHVSSYFIATVILASTLAAQDADPGRVVFEGRCARCHGAAGNGGELVRQFAAASRRVTINGW